MTIGYLPILKIGYLKMKDMSCVLVPAALICVLVDQTSDIHLLESSRVASHPVETISYMVSPLLEKANLERY